jgi:uncharacterized circularly permuted ATP-grasp superfamily protein
MPIELLKYPQTNIYGELLDASVQRIVKDGVLPLEVLAGSVSLCAQRKGMRPLFGVWALVCGTDLVRDQDGTAIMTGTG